MESAQSVEERHFVEERMSEKKPLSVLKEKDGIGV